MSTISKPNTFTSSTTISSSAVNDNFDTIYNEFNGSVSAANLATDAVTTAKITDANVTTAKLASGAITNATLNTSAGELGGAWASYTPTWVNLAIGTGGSASNTMYYNQRGKTVRVQGHIRLGTSGMSVSGTANFTLPVTASTTKYLNTSDCVLGEATFREDGGSLYAGVVRHTSSTTASLLSQGSGTYSSTSSTVPFTWGADDRIWVNLVYEAA